ncbi:MAG: molybdopterin-dependent oxidoreductase [Rhodospirillaceae bacterium]|nr:molybdopterin-dependent oxidoreductase [Rhodospirillaceae bacterium]
MRGFVGFVVALVLAGAVCAAPSWAGEGQPKLVVNGVSFDLEALEKMPVATVDTTSPWTDGVTKFEGVSAKALLDAAGAKAGVFKATALDDYAVEIPREDLEKAIIAYKMDGAPLDEQFGPYWIIYDYDAGFGDEPHQERSVYKLKALEPK